MPIPANLSFLSGFRPEKDVVRIDAAGGAAQVPVQGVPSVRDLSGSKRLRDSVCDRIPVIGTRCAVDDR